MDRDSKGHGLLLTTARYFGRTERLTMAAAEISPRIRYEELKAMKLNLDMRRGAPSREQLELSLPILTSRRTVSPSGVDCLNYGALEGLPEMRTLFGEYLGAPLDQTFVLGNSSLAIMHDLVVQAMLRTPPGGGFKWDMKGVFRKRPMMLCPVPGYDRHHTICETYGIDMIPIPLKDNGPDMDIVVEHVKDPFVVGIWCVPKFANPTGISYSEAVCRRLAWMKVASGSFRIFWDNAYAVHDLTDEPTHIPNMLELCKEARHEDRVFVIGSLSKVTFASAGVAALASSERNMEWFRKGLVAQNIGYDKLNQLWHWEFLRNMDGIREHMKKHRVILKPKFDAVDEIFTRELGNKGIARWNKPRGGYFVSLFVKKGCAKRVVELAADIGVKLTAAGAAYPYGKDPDDSHIRIAPTLPPLEEVQEAMEAVALCVKLAADE